MKIKLCLWCQSNRLNKKSVRSDGRSILQCQNCQLLMVDEIPDDTAQIYNSQYFEKAEEKSAEGYKDYLSSPVASLAGKYAFSKLFLSETDRRGLDLGCADGSLMEIFDYYGYEMQGLDISEVAVARAREKGLRASVSNLERLSSPDIASDFICAFDLIEHLAAPSKTLQEVFRVLKPGGYFFYSTLHLKNMGPEEYWFNHSLEHFIYYTQEVFNQRLKSIFGRGRTLNFVVEVNGVSEIYGIAKKGPLSKKDRETIEIIKNKKTFSNGDKRNIYLSLLYNQFSWFREAEKAAREISKISTQEKIFLQFINAFSQGNYNQALEVIAAHKESLALSDPIFWQAYAFILEKYKNSEVKKDERFNRIMLKELEEILDEKNRTIAQKEQILIEKEQVLQGYYNSRVIRTAIKLRDGLRRWKCVLMEAEAKLIHWGRKHLSERTKSFLRPFLRMKFKVRIVQAKNRRWEDTLISVVTPYFNRTDTIKETMESVLKQTYQNFEYIIIDDGSTDPKSREVFDAISHPKIKKIKQKNQGVAIARNTGIEQAKGKYILCLDSDDYIDPTYIEKMLVLLESNPECDIAYSHIHSFGFENAIYYEPEFNAKKLYRGNIFTTASVFKKEYWKKAGGYKPGIGYEDWELWLNMVEHGACGKLLPETIFHYRRSGESRYINDLQQSDKHIRKIKSLHMQYFKNIRRYSKKFISAKYIWEDESQFINLRNIADYRSPDPKKKNVLILLNWLTFGGAETVVYNFCSQLKKQYNISFITGLKSKNEWGYRFGEITFNIYHLPNLLSDSDEEYDKFIANYIKTRLINIVHVIHSSVFFPMLEKIKTDFPELKVINTVFNTKAEHFWNAKKVESYIDIFTTDNSKVVPIFEKNFPDAPVIRVIPNGIDCWKKFHYARFDREEERKKLGLAKDDLAVYFIGRLSGEKGVDIFLEAAQIVLRRGKEKIKFFVVGDGPLQRKVVRKIEKIGDSRIKYLGYQEDIPRYLSTADIFVLSSRIEGFPLSNVEAMAMKVCVIAADVGGVSDAIEDGETGFLVPPENSQAIAEKIMMLADNRKLMKQIGENARKKVEEKFSLQTMADQYKDIYEK